MFDERAYVARLPIGEPTNMQNVQPGTSVDATWISRGNRSNEHGRGELSRGKQACGKSGGNKFSDSESRRRESRDVREVKWVRTQI